MIVITEVLPGHMVAFPVIFAVGNGFTVTVTDFDTVHAPIEEETEYTVVTNGVTVGLVLLGVVSVKSIGAEVHEYRLELPVTDSVVELPIQTATLLLTVKLGPTTTFPIVAVDGNGRALSVTETV